jgi:beta-N-acetylhexosaminidase
MTIDLTAKPFYLSQDQQTWVQKTLTEMSTDEKIGQLFLPIGMSKESQDLDALLKYHIGGLFFRPGNKEDIHQAYQYAQDHSKIPLLTAANLEDGSNGAIANGTGYGRQMAVSAANDPKYAYTLGKIAAHDAKAVGVNWGFSPVVDLDFNFRNPIINVRSYGNNPDTVIANAKEYIRAFDEQHMLTSIKHFPGDGVDERDQHLLTSVNSLPVSSWMKTYGKVYRSLIDYGVKAVMVGHIAFPAYSHDQLPATLNPRLLKDLLREELGFRGLIITDASNMVGMNSAMDRKTAVPTAIQAGCDMFLFYRDFVEDFNYMKEGLESGLLTEERLNEAVTRILATKAAIGLNEGVDHGDLVLGDYQAEQAELADQAITLVKDDDQLLPLTAAKSRRVLLELLGKQDDRVLTRVKQQLEKRGFTVTVYQPESNLFEVESVEEFKAKYDLVLYVANVETESNQTTARINWYTLYGLGNNLPWFVKEVPTVFLSLGNPYHYFDVPMIGTIVNAYCNYDHFIDAAIAKLAGESQFKGTSPVNALCENKILEELKRES